MFGYIYLTTNLVNGRLYVGQHAGAFDPAYKGSGFLLKRALRRYGSHCFDVHVLEWITEESDMDSAEIGHIKSFAKWEPNLYNVSLGGNRMTRATIAKAAQARIGMKASAETRLKIGLASRGRKHSPESRAKMSAARKGIPRPVSFIERLKLRHAQNPEWGRKCSEAIRKAVNGVVKTREHRAKLSAAQHAFQVRKRMVQSY